MEKLYYDHDIDDWCNKICPFLGQPCIEQRCIFFVNDCLILNYIEKVLEK